MQKNQRVFKLVMDISLRSEDFGGLAFVPITGEVIQLNHTAYKLLKDIIDRKELMVNSKDLIFWQKLEIRGVVKEVKPDD